VARRLAPVAGTARPRLVAVKLANGAELVATLLACWRDGLVPMPLDEETSDAEALDLCRLLGSWLVRQTAIVEPGEAAAPVALPPDTALLKLTSGTTGLPRAVALTGSALRSGVANILSTMQITPHDRNLGTIPLAHSYGFDNLVLPLVLHGLPLILARDLIPRRLLTVAREARASVFPAVPFVLDLLTRARLSGQALPDLRLVISAGAPLLASTRERFAARFGVKPRTFYGATECGGITFDRDAAAELPEGCVGAALDGVRVELVEAQGEVGRVSVQSAAVAEGYVSTQSPAPSGDAELGGGRFLTADLGRFDDQRRLHLVGRATEVVNVGGRKVHPAEVERVISRIEGVLDVVVLGVERSPVAQALRAIVVARPEIDRAAIVAACEASLARHKVPRLIEFRDHLPRTARGKLDRRRLSEE
jgi:acyl-CoA synthetase (AMP-forming)/AMP-acid ligase II